METELPPPHAAEESRRLEERPLVAIVGRPNVGKSSLFNRLLGSRRAIVEPTAGVTRDRLILPVTWQSPDLDFDLMDTGGIGQVDRSDLSQAVELQVLTGVHAAQLLLFLVDAREGLTVLDEQVARLLRRADRPILLLANKCETGAARRNLGDFQRLGLGEALALSAVEGIGVGELQELLAEHLPPAAQVPPPAAGLRITVLGRRNTGKSSFVNQLLGEQRVIVSEVPGTTRDAIDVSFVWDGRPVTLVDTAGVHRRSKVANAIEFFSLARSDQAIRRADVALLFLDLTEPVVQIDQDLARTIHDRYKPVVIAGTKSDLVPDLQVAQFRAAVAAELPHLAGAPVFLISNTERRGLTRVMKVAFELFEEASRRVSTGELNRALVQTFDKLSFRGRSEKPKAYYATQLRTAPPTFLLFVNRKQLFSKEALRAISKELRRRLGFPRVPLRLLLRERE